MGYAEKTAVAPEKTRAEIETLLRKYRADCFCSGWRESGIFVQFRARQVMIEFSARVPDVVKPPMVKWTAAFALHQGQVGVD